MRFRLCSSFGGLLLAASLATAGSALALPPTEIVRFLDRQRAANGIPGPLHEDPSLSTGCERHNRYMELNPRAYPHSEEPGQPGYTTEGANVASISLLANVDRPFEAGVNPFEYSPFHLQGLLNPTLSITGVSESHGWICIVTGQGPARHATADMRLYSYPGPGRTGVRSQEFEDELPVAPGDVLGYGQRTPTGPHVYLFAFGPENVALSMRVRSAQLVGPSGSVPVKWVDNVAPRNGAQYTELASAIVVAPRPVPAGTYCLTVKLSVENVPGIATHRVGFVTQDAPAGARPPASCVGYKPAGLRLESIRRRGRNVTLVGSVNRGSRGVLTGAAGMRYRLERLRQVGRLRRVGAHLIGTFSGTVLPNPGARWMRVRWSSAEATAARARSRSESFPLRGRALRLSPSG